jgi:hypothetical protein
LVTTASAGRALSESGGPEDCLVARFGRACGGGSVGDRLAGTGRRVVLE